MIAPHPGHILRDRINGLGLTQLDFGQRNKGIHWVEINRVIKGHVAITPQIAMIFAKIFSTTPQYWMHLQADWDMERHQIELADPLQARPRDRKLRKRQAEIVARTRVFE